MSTYAQRAATYRITTVQFHREEDARIVRWLDGQRDMSAAVRAACNHYLEAQAGASRNGQAAEDPDAIKRVLEEALAGHLADVRRVVDTALASAVVAAPVEANGGGDEAADLLESLDRSLDMEEL